MKWLVKVQMGNNSVGVAYRLTDKDAYYCYIWNGGKAAICSVNRENFLHYGKWYTIRDYPHKMPLGESDRLSVLGTEIQSKYTSVTEVLDRLIITPHIRLRRYRPSVWRRVWHRVTRRPYDWGQKNVFGSRLLRTP